MIVIHFIIEHVTTSLTAVDSIKYLAIVVLLNTNWVFLIWTSLVINNSIYNTIVINSPLTFTVPHTCCLTYDSLPFGFTNYTIVSWVCILLSSQELYRLSFPNFSFYFFFRNSGNCYPSHEFRNEIFPLNIVIGFSH